jgi:hypothetical protein
MLATQSQKTKTCPYCGSHVNLQRSKHIAAAKTGVEASEILRKLKAEQGFTNEP